MSSSRATCSCDAAHAGQIARRAARASVGGQQCAVHRHRLRRVFDAAGGAEPAVRAQRIVGSAVAARAADDALPIPVQRRDRAGTCCPDAGCGAAIQAWSSVSWHDCPRRGGGCRGSRAPRAAASPRASACSSGRPRAAGMADAQASSARSARRVGAASASGSTLIRASECALRCGASTSAMPNASGIGRAACKRLRVGGVVGDQQHRRVVDHHLGQRLEQAGAEAGVVGAQHRRWAPSRRWRCSSSRRRRCAPSCGSGSARSAGRRSPASRRSRGSCRRRRRRRKTRSARCAASSPAAAAASRPTASASLTTRPVRRRSAGGSDRGAGSTVGLRPIAAAARKHGLAAPASRSGRGRAGRCRRCRR